MILQSGGGRLNYWELMKRSLRCLLGHRWGGGSRGQRVARGVFSSNDNRLDTNISSGLALQCFAASRRPSCPILCNLQSYTWRQDEMLAVEDVFPEDPFEPTVEYIGASQTPFTVPWTIGRIQLCAGLNSRRSPDDALFLNHSAFQNTLHVPLQYRECQSTSLKDDSASNIATSSVNTTFAISASVGGGFLGASGRGRYEKNVRDNKNVSTAIPRGAYQR